MSRFGRESKTNIAPQSGAHYERLKRVFDVTVAATLLPLTLPIMAGAALAITLEDGQSPIYLSKRLGRNGRIFRMVKLRTMRTLPGTDDAHGARQRVTVVGRLLRKTKVDELPQFLNVLLGSMSLVGPRPHIPEESHIVDDPCVLSVRPGITDLSSLVFIDLGEAVHRSDVPVSLSEVARWKRFLARLYVDKRSVTLDVKILVLTAVAIVWRPIVGPAVERLLLSLGVSATEARGFFSSWYGHANAGASGVVFPAPPVEVRK